MKYSKNFEQSYKWYLSVSHIFCFDGTDQYFNKKGVSLIQHDVNGKTARECFYLYDTSGIVKPTCEPDELKTLLKTKGSVNLHIKMYAEDRAKGYLPKIEFDKICAELDLPDWFVDAVENQKKKYGGAPVIDTSKRYRTYPRVEEQTEEEVKEFIKSTEDYYNGKYHSHQKKKWFDPNLKKDVWLLSITVTKKENEKFIN